MTRFARALVLAWLTLGPPALAGETVESLTAAGHFKAALERSTALYDVPEPSAAVRAVHGCALFRAGRLREAQQVLEPLASEENPPAKGLVVLARLSGARGDHERAHRLARRAVEQAPADPFVLFWAAELSLDRERSNELLERYLERAPEGQTDWIEAARGTMRLRQALGERDVWRVTHAPERVELPLRLVWNDARRKLGYVVEAHIGPKDKPVKLMLDTGSTGLFLVERIARKRGFEFLSEETAFGGGGDKRHRNRRGVFSSFRLGELRFENALAGTTAGDLEPYGRFHGLLGIQALAGYRAILDLGAQTLTLERYDENAEGPAGDPFWMISGQMLVEARVGDSAGGLFLFDTGATWSIVSNRFADGLEGARRAAGGGLRGFGGKIEGVSSIHGVDVRFAGLSSGDNPLRAFDMSVRNSVAGLEVSGFIGLDLLSEVVITIDTVRQEVRVEPRQRRGQSKDSSSSSKRSSPAKAAR